MIASIPSSSFAVYVDAHIFVPLRFRWLMVIPSSTLRFRLVPQSRHTVYISYSLRKRLRRPPTILLLLPVSRHIISSLRGFIRYVRPSWLLLLLPLPFLPLSLRSSHSHQSFHTAISCTLFYIALLFLFVPCFRCPPPEFSFALPFAFAWILIMMMHIVRCPLRIRTPPPISGSLSWIIWMGVRGVRRCRSGPALVVASGHLEWLLP